MAVDSLQKTAKTAAPEAPARRPGRPFRKGESGNPKGRPRGSRNRKTRLAELLLEGESEKLARKAVELALKGDPLALKLCLDRLIAPRRERAIEFELPPIRTIADLDAMVSAVAAAVAEGEITPGEAVEVAKAVASFVGVLEASRADRRGRQSWGAERWDGVGRTARAGQSPDGAGNITKT
jgi:hypothetical protein